MAKKKPKKEVKTGSKCILCGKAIKPEELSPFCPTCQKKVQARGTSKWIKSQFKTKK